MSLKRFKPYYFNVKRIFNIVKKGEKINKMSDGKGGMPQGIRTVILWTLGIGVLALILIVLLILFGNLSGNVGFEVGTEGYNNTQSVITDYSESATNTSSQFPVVGTIIGIALLLVILIGVLIFAIKKLMAVSGSSGSNASFG